MSITHQVQTKVSSNSQGALSGQVSEVGATELVLDRTIAASQTNLLQTLSITVADIQSLYLLASTDLTIKTNSSGSPADTLNLKAGMPLQWSKSPGYFTRPLGTDVTAFYYTNGTAATSLVGRVLTS